MGEWPDEGRFFLSVITIAAFDKGIAQLADDDPSRLRHVASRDLTIQRFAGRLLPVTDNIIRCWGVLAGRIKRDTGHPPPVIDTLIAATALEHRLYLVTRNTRDMKFTGALVFNPWDNDPRNFPVTS